MFLLVDLIGRSRKTCTFLVCRCQEALALGPRFNKKNTVKSWLNPRIPHLRCAAFYFRKHGVGIARNAFDEANPKFLNRWSPKITKLRPAHLYTFAL